MKTWHIIAGLSGLAFAGYLVYKNKQDATVPLNETDNTPGLPGLVPSSEVSAPTPEDDRPAADPVISKVPIPIVNTIQPVKETEYVTGEVADVGLVTPVAPATAITTEPVPDSTSQVLYTPDTFMDLNTIYHPRDLLRTI